MNKYWTLMNTSTKTLRGELLKDIYEYKIIEDIVWSHMKVWVNIMDGTYIRVHKDYKEQVKLIVAEWEKITRMEMEETKFEKIWFLTTADYFATYLNKKGEIEVKSKGMFEEEVKLGKGMEFPIIAKAVKGHFLKNIPYENYIRNHDNILDFCSFKKLKREFECFHNSLPQQRINRFFACRTGAYLYKRKYDEKRQRYQIDHVLKDSPVTIYNEFNDISMKNRNINYSYYIGQARDIIYKIQNKDQLTLF